MTENFRDLVIGDVLISPFVSHAAVGMVIVLVLRPVLAHIDFDRRFAAPPVVRLCLYVLIVALLVVTA